MKVPVYYVNDDEYFFEPTGATTTINAEAGAKVIKEMVSCMLCDIGRGEYHDPTPIEDLMRKHGMIDDNYDPNDEDNW